MRKISLLFVLCVVVATLSAQKSNIKFAYGIATDVVSIPLAAKSLQSHCTNAFVAIYPTENLHFKVGVGDNLLLNSRIEQYQHLPELQIGAGYTVFRQGVFSNDISLSVSNAFQQFSEFKDYHADLSARFKIVDVCFIGAGFRYQHNNASNLLFSPKDGVCFVMELGIQLYIGKNPKLTK